VRCGFRPGRSTADQIFEKFWDYAKGTCACFVDLENAESYEIIPREKLWGALRKCDVKVRLLLAVKLSYSCSNVCARMGGVKSQPLTVGVEF